MEHSPCPDTRIFVNYLALALNYARKTIIQAAVRHSPSMRSKKAPRH